MPFRNKVWTIENYDEATRRKVKGYAGANGLTISQALTKLVDLALAQPKN